jgi:molecular chaperone HscA
VVQGERELVADCRSLARFELRGIPPMVAGAARIRITFQVDADGLLSVSARETSSGVEAHVTVKPSYGLNDAEVARMLQESSTHARDDMQARALAEAKVEGERLLESTQAALQEDGAALLKPDEASAVEGLMVTLRHSLAGTDMGAIKRDTAALNQGTVEFASRRMDRSVRKALTGHRLDELEA